MPAGITGLVAAIGGGLASASAGVGGALAGLGIGADTAGIIGTGLVDAGVGAGTGALSSAVTGGNIGQGAEFGALSGGLGGAGGGLAANLGLDSGVGSALGGALGGAGASAISGSNPITGALLGGVSGFGANSLNPTGAGPAGAGPGAGASAAATAAPGAVSAGGPAADLTSVNVTPEASLGGTGSTSSALGLSPVTVTPAQTLPGASSSGLFGTGISPGQAISGLGLAYSALKPESGVQKQLQAKANSLGAEGQSLMSYIQNGSLPPGLQESVNLASQDAQAGIKSTFANLGASGSTSEAQALADTKQRAQAQAGQYALSLLQSGLQTSGMSADLLTGILNYNAAEDKDLTDALAGFAAAGSGGSTTPGFTVKVGA